LACLGQPSHLQVSGALVTVVSSVSIVQRVDYSPVAVLLIAFMLRMMS
jgi:hypothetical protein